jgi:hypothetical protein
MVFSKKKSDGFKNFEELNFGYSSAVGFFFFAGLGFWADQHWQTGFRFTLTGVFTGFCFIAYEVWKIIQNLNEPKDKNK